MFSDSLASVKYNPPSFSAMCESKLHIFVYTCAYHNYAIFVGSKPEDWHNEWSKVKVPVNAHAEDRYLFTAVKRNIGAQFQLEGHLELDDIAVN